MPHNRFYLKEPLLENSTVLVEGDEHHHMTKVMRQRVGDIVELIDGEGTLALAKIESNQKKHAELKITKTQKEKPYNRSFGISIAIIKPASLELVCEKITELGATEIKIFPADRSEKSHLSNHTLNRLQRHIISAVKQSGRLYSPSLQIMSSLEACIEENSFYCDIVENTEKLSCCCMNLSYVHALIGPESGWSDSEKKLLKSQCTCTLLHPNTLRAETAAIAAASLIANELY